jgi:hypothetical protein
MEIIFSLRGGSIRSYFIKYIILLNLIKMVGSMGNVCNDNDFKNQVPYAPILMLLNLIKKGWEYG